MTITASAPGKLVLMGDHAVVHDRPALVTAVDLRYRVQVDRIDTEEIRIDTPAFSGRRVALAALDHLDERETAFVEAAVRRVFDHVGQQTGLHITTAGPAISYGLGSSSAVTAAAVMAVAAALGVELEQRTAFDLAYGAVLDVQGKGSGVDLAAAVYGGTVYYVRGGAVLEPLADVDLPLLIGYSGSKVSTTDLIGHVAALRQRQPGYIDRVFDMMGELATDARRAVERADWTSLGDLVNIHQGLLDTLGTNTVPLARLIFAARDAGALGAKFSGAGGGDCMFAVVTDEHRAGVMDALNQYGQCVNISLGAMGIRLE